MKKLLTILLILISFSTFAQFEAGEYINSDTVKIDGVPLLLNTFKQGNLGGASNIFYSTGASSQPASGTVNQVVGNNYIQNQNSSAQDANFWINGSIKSTNVNIGLDQSIRWGGGYASGHPLILGSATAIHMYPGGNTYSGNVYINTEKVYHAGNSNRLDVNWNARQFISNIPTGIPPLVVASSTKVDSLNAGLLDGKKASDFQLKSDTTTYDATLSDLADSSAAIRALANTKAVVLGTDNYIMKKTGANTIGNSLIQDNGTAISIGLPVQNNNRFQSVNNITAVGASELGISEIGAQTYNYWNTPTYTGSLLRQYGSGTTGTVAGISAKNLGALIFQNTDTALIYTNGATPIIFGTTSASRNILTADGLNGFGTTTPAARIHSQSTGTQARLGYDANKYTDLSTGSTGDLTIDPTGDTVKVVGAVNSTGGFFKNGVEITGGGGGGISNIGITVPTGLTVSPESLTANGTFTFGLQSGYSIPTTANQTNWTSGYNNQIISMAITGTTTKQIQLNQIDGGHVYGSFTDLSEAAWVDDTYGIKYTAGKVGIGIGSNSGNLLTVGDGSTNTNIAIRASSLNQRSIYATSSSNTAIEGQGGLDGVGGVGTRYGVHGSSVNGNGVRGASTNAAGISGTSTYSYGGEFSGLGVNISSGGLLINGTTRISSTGTFTPSNGASGSFTSADGKTITVTNGIITGIN